MRHLPPLGTDRRPHGKNNHFQWGRLGIMRATRGHLSDPHAATPCDTEKALRQEGPSEQFRHEQCGYLMMSPMLPQRTRNFSRSQDQYLMKASPLIWLFLTKPQNRLS